MEDSLLINSIPVITEQMDELKTAVFISHAFEELLNSIWESKYDPIGLLLARKDLVSCNFRIRGVVEFHLGKQV
jgi:hypothetical protein